MREEMSKLAERARKLTEKFEKKNKDTCKNDK